MKKKLLTTILTSAFIFTGLTTTYADETISEQDMEAQKINQEHREELRDIWDDYDVEFKEDQPKAGITGLGYRGDILIALDSIVDHVGIVRDDYIVIEAHPDTGDVANRQNNWQTRYSDIKALGVSTSYTNKVNAISYAQAQLGEPYSITSGRWSTDKWYCSKLVWRAFYEQDVELEGRTYEPRGTHVTPGDILDNPNTYVRWSSK